jgi:hypothetical protein
MKNTTTIEINAARALEDVAQALAGEHDFGADATTAGYSLIMWSGPNDPCGYDTWSDCARSVARDDDDRTLELAERSADARSRRE